MLLCYLCSVSQIAKKTSTFSSRIGFLIAASSVAVGLGNILRFPAEVGQHGGGGFLLLYGGCMLLLGYPLTLMELALGRATKGIFQAYKQYPGWHWLGRLTAFNAFLFYLFYHVVAAWVVGYLWACASGALWESKITFELIKANPSNNLLAAWWLFLVAALISQAGVQKGIERMAKLLLPPLLLILLLLVGYALTLPEAVAGLSFYLLPSYAVFSWSGLVAALSQSFMSLGVGAGLMITYGSYVDQEDSLPSAATIIVLSDTLVALLAGFFIFPLLFSQGGDPTSGYALAFETLPLVFLSLGRVVGAIIGSLFFILLLFAALTSSVAMLETASTYLASSAGIGKKKALWLITAATTILSTSCIADEAGILGFSKYWGHTLLSLLEWVTLYITIPVAALSFSLFIRMKWKVNFWVAIGGKNNNPPWLLAYLNFVIGYAIPFLLVLMLLLQLTALA